MKLSIITVCFNSVSTLEDTILSIKSQNYKGAVEYIIIDGKSNDGTINILNKYSEFISIIVSEVDTGIYDAMNKGISLCTGDVVGILNSDDLFYDSAVLETVMEEFDIDETVDIVYGDVVYVKSRDTNSVVRRWKSRQYSKYFFELGDVPPHPSLFVKKIVYDKVGLFDLDFKLAADYEFMLRLFRINHFNSKYISKIFVKMRLGGVTNKNYLNIIRQNTEIYRAWKKNRMSFPTLLFPLKFLKRLIQFL